MAQWHLAPGSFSWDAAAAARQQCRTQRIPARPDPDPVGAGNCVTLCDLGVFADQAAEPVSPQHPDTCACYGWVPTPRGRVLLQRPRSANPGSQPPLRMSSAARGTGVITGAGVADVRRGATARSVTGSSSPPPLTWRSASAPSASASGSPRSAAHSAPTEGSGNSARTSSGESGRRGDDADAIGQRSRIVGGQRPGEHDQVSYPGIGHRVVGEPPGTAGFDVPASGQAGQMG